MTEPRLRVGAALASRLRDWTTLLRGHLALVALVAVAAALRAVALVAVYPGIWFSDTNGYLTAATTGTLSVVRVSGYALFVAPFVHLKSAAALIVVQHLLGLAIVVLLYALLVHRGVPRFLALLAVIPAALDAYVIAIEHMILSETIFHLAVVGAIAALLWSDRPGVVTAAVAGLLLGYAGVVRSVAVPLVAVFVVYLLVRRVGLYRLAAFCAGCALVFGGYMTLYKIQHGQFAFTGWGGRFLYAKVAPFADCKRLHDLPADERSLCPDPRHPRGTVGYLWGRKSPLRGLPLSADSRLGDFGKRVVKAQPLSYARVVASDFFHYFEPGHRARAGDSLVTTWQFPTDPGHWSYPGYRGPIRPMAPGPRRAIEPGPYVDGIVGRPSLNATASRFLHYYQLFFYTSGQVLAACVLVVIGGLAWRPRRGWRLRLDAALLAATALGALLATSALAIFSVRYSLIAAILLPGAAALAGTALLEARGRDDV